MGKGILGVAAGNGVLLHAMKDNVIGNIEPRSAFKTEKDRQWEMNFKGIPLCKSLEEAEKYNFKPQVIVGHPDCGSGSILSYSRAKRLSSIGNNDSFITFRLAIRKYKPEVFLFENLERLFKNYTEAQFKRDFKGYKLIFRVMPVSKLGNSQVFRERLLVIGINRKVYTGGMSKLFRPFKVSNGPKITRKLFKNFDYTENLDFGVYTEPLSDIITMYGGFKISLEEARQKWVKELKYKSRWPAVDRKYAAAPAVYKNLPNKYPATARKSNRQFNSLGVNMSPRELAIIQGVPDDFKLILRPSKVKADTNKAKVTVTKSPPYEVGIWFKQCLGLYLDMKKEKKKEKGDKKKKEKEKPITHLR